MTALLNRALATIPSSVNFLNNTKEYYPTCLTTEYGCCTLAAVVHYRQTMALLTGSTYAYEGDVQFLKDYKFLCGYSGQKPGKEGGFSISDILLWWNGTYQTGGVTLFQPSLVDYCSLNNDSFSNETLIKACIWMFGGLMVALKLPTTIKGQLYKDGGWSIVDQNGKPAPGVYGHCVYIGGYDANNLYMVTAGKTGFITWDFWKQYLQEAFILMPTDWYETMHNRLSQFKNPALQAVINDLPKTGPKYT